MEEKEYYFYKYNYHNSITEKKMRNHEDKYCFKYFIPLISMVKHNYIYKYNLSEEKLFFW